MCIPSGLLNHNVSLLTVLPSSLYPLSLRSLYGISNIESLVKITKEKLIICDFLNC